ncbi:NAD+ synthase [Thermosynechococcus sp. GLH187]|uniref:NAD+ synthase n=1 Tax=unclassified Thermosynechococcus TaxID=2622553 RepID=UPI002877E941|nr:NAD+ synthase [Thermosynechococcus sp. GLH187]WNC48302.1 NAD+ synthase [Thermosynechococcus sp. GLH333]WNC50835.1 NAD+ synthase [Thermosynechococcus sp. GLH87]
MAVHLWIAQLNPTVGSLKANAQAILTAVQEIRSQHPLDLLITSELALCGYPPKDLLLNRYFVEAIQAELHRLAAALPADVAVLVGTVLANPAAGVKGEKPLYNGAALLKGGQVQQAFAKQLLPTYDVFDECRYFAPGGTENLFTLTTASDQLKIGVTICEDLWNNEQFWGERHYQRNPVAELVAQGADLIVNLSASPYCVGKPKLRQALIEHTARQYGCPLIYANQVGGNDDLIFDGSSLAVNRQGEIVSQAKGFREDYLAVRWEKGDLEPTAIAPAATGEPEEIWQALVLGVRDYVRKCGFQQVVIGLSGGIDSALVAAIATAALGNQQVLGVLMPSPYSSDHSITDAKDLAANLGIATQILPIAPLMQTYSEVLAPLFAGTPSGVAEENIQARIRGTLLMAIANKFGHLLISTGNKSELAVGYCTLYGDMNGGLAAIADVPKTRVYELCHWLNQQAAQGHPIPELAIAGAVVIPPHILTKAPSAELKPGQTDQDSLPPYDILDGILVRMIDRHQSDQEIAAAGYDLDLVQRVRRMVQRAEFKRQQAAPGLKVTDRAFGSGWRMPIAAQW